MLGYFFYKCVSPSGLLENSCFLELGLGFVSMLRHTCMFYIQNDNPIVVNSHGMWGIFNPRETPLCL